MADAQPNSGGLAVNPPGMVKKKKAKAPRKPRSKCTPEEIAKLDAESAKRRNRGAVVKDNATAPKFAAERDAMEAGAAQGRGFSVAAVGPASTCSSVARPPHCQSPASRTTPMSPDFPPPRHDGQTRFSGSPDVGVIMPSTRSPWVQQRRPAVRRDAKKASTTVVYGHHAVPPRLVQRNSKVDDIRDALSMALHETLHVMMSQKDVRDEKKRQSKDEQMKQYLEFQRKKLEMEEAAKNRKIDMEEAARQRQLDIEAANVKARQRQLDIEATNAATKAKEVALAIMSVDLTKMNEKTRSWFKASQKEMFDADGLN
ncbi:hypothetical protein VPH35_110924 [Triticum aestivum]